MIHIKKIKALEILDSRGNPTIATEVELKNGIKAAAAVPSGASTGSHEAKEFRDGGKRFQGKGVLRAINNINQKINYNLRNKKFKNVREIDELLIKLDGTNNKSKLGANAILAVSLACARAGAYQSKMPLYKFLRYEFDLKQKIVMPRPTMNVLNGGRHADNGLSIQEFMIVPSQKKFSERLRAGSEIYHALKTILLSKGLATGLGDEGGFAPALKNNEQAFQFLSMAVKKAGYKLGKDVFLATDIAASEFYQKNRYIFEKKSRSADWLMNLYEKWIKKYPLIFIEDGLAEDDWQNWTKMTTKLASKVLLVGDDLFVTNLKRLQKGINEKVANAILIKLNQIGSLSETIDTIKLARKSNYQIIISHRSGETTDDFIADLAVATSAEFIKTGAPARSERVTKYNRLLKIEKFYLR